MARFRLRRSALIPAIGTAVALALITAAALAQESEAPVFAGGSQAVRQAKQDLIFRGAKAEARERKEATEKLRRMGRKRAMELLRGARVGPAAPEDAGTTPAGPAVAAPPARVTSTSTIPTNVIVNNRTGDAAGDTQAEEGLAIVGNFGLCAWNDGHNFSSTTDAQQWAYTTNGGASWVDFGSPPRPPGGRWASDPVVTVNEKTGTFYYVGLIDFPQAGTNGIVTVPATFPGGVFTPGSPRIIRNAPNSGLFFDKQWMVADSTTGNLYVTYTTFNAAFTTDSVLLQRSTDGGLTWGSPITLNSPGSFGFVQGSRPTVGPAGEVYACWYEIGPSFDFMKVRKSTNLGVSFAGEAVVEMFANFGTGGPGFNRDHSVNFPSIAVDRSTGPHRGRVYMAWNESVNWYDDPLGGGGAKSEVEPDDATGTATLFTPGERLRGTLSTSVDLDFFKFNATQGESYIFWCDSLNSTLQYTMRVFCTDGTTRLAFSGSTSGGGGQGFIVWTAPATATYYLRMAAITGGPTARYRIETGVDLPSGDDFARDQRDAMVTSSDDGVTWSAQTVVNDDAAFFDNYLSEVGVTCEGYPYSIWYDFRGGPPANCGGVADIYVTRSLDGGGTWAANQRLTSVATNFTVAGSNLQPNMGDYSLISAGENVAVAWADGRMGDVDVWATRLIATPTLTCPTVDPVLPGGTFDVVYSVLNPNLLFGNTYSLELDDEQGWTITPTPQNLALASSTSGDVTFSVSVPESPSSLSNNLILTASAQDGGVCALCVVPITVIGAPTDVPHSGAMLALAGAWPNPASAVDLSIRFSLASSSPALLELLDLGGRRLLAREVGSMGPGGHVVSWQREASGLAAGLYVVRLTQGGRSLTAKVVLVR